jgi:thioredoxin-dependent peroxiredoxin
MKTLLTTLLLLCGLCGLPAYGSGFEGVSAPAFSLPDQDGKTRTLASFAGRWLVLYFYPKDNTPGCTTEAKNFVRDYSKFAAMNTEIAGISLDDVASHKEFAEVVGATFPLLADTDKQAAKAYKTLSSFGPFDMAKRQTFVINPEGLVVKHYIEVSAKEHSDQLLKDLQILQK